MDHSIEGYLRRRTTEELRYLLNDYHAKEIPEAEAHIVQIIMDILCERLCVELPPD